MLPKYSAHGPTQPMHHGSQVQTYVRLVWYIFNLLLSNSLSSPPKHLAARAGYLSRRLTTAVYTRVRLDYQALVSASSVVSPLAHTPASRGGTDPFAPQTLGSASRASFDAASARGLHTPLAHTPASRGVLQVRNWHKTGNRVPSSLCPRLRLLLHLHILLGGLAAVLPFKLDRSQL
jgi:hypothetical protein